MSSKANKFRKPKRTPVRIITPKTAGLPDRTNPAIACDRIADAPPNEQQAGNIFVSRSLIPELKRIGLLFAIMLVLLIILSYIL
ncbi:MAG: hypothetical protein JW954_08620 [Dehalococcoidaceae bacterium]|nr:hypothetical protein [Dehalococcoidaceae bacterium]